MPRTRNPYPAEFREQIVALARTGRGVEDLAREFEPCVATIHGGIKQADRDGGSRADGLNSDERDELRRLRPGEHPSRQDPVAVRAPTNSDPSRQDSPTSWTRPSPTCWPI